MLLVGLRKGKWQERLWFPAFEVVLNSLRFRLFPKNCPREWRVGWRFFACGRLVFWSRFTMIAEFACQGLKQKQQWTRSEALLRASRTRLDREGSFWLDANDRFELIQIWGSKKITRKTEYVLHRVPVGRLAIMTRKVWGEKSPWVSFAAFPEPLGEGEQWYSSYYVHVSVTPYSELMHREFPDHHTPR